MQRTTGQHHTIGTATPEVIASHSPTKRDADEASHHSAHASPIFCFECFQRITLFMLFMLPAWFDRSCLVNQTMSRLCKVYIRDSTQH
jgi:hypothetical protein